MYLELGGDFRRKGNKIGEPRKGERSLDKYNYPHFSRDLLKYSLGKNKLLLMSSSPNNFWAHRG